MPMHPVRTATITLSVLSAGLLCASLTEAGPFFRSKNCGCAQPAPVEAVCESCQCQKCKTKSGPKDPPVAPVVGVIPTALIAQTVVPLAPGALPTNNRADQVDRLMRLLEAVEASNCPAPASAPVTDLELQRDLQLMRLLLQELRKQP